MFKGNYVRGFGFVFTKRFGSKNSINERRLFFDCKKKNDEEGFLLSSYYIPLEFISLRADFVYRTCPQTG